VILHVRRRRWVDVSGKSYSLNWELTAAGTRYSREILSTYLDDLEENHVTKVHENIEICKREK
jgi:hypothetical protein